MKPILKWAGGKGRMWKHIEPLLPKEINTYFEPFFGSGALFLKIKSNKSVINDINKELMNVYEAIKNDAKKVNFYLRKFEKRDSKEFFLELREMDRTVNLLNKKKSYFRAARTIYLNKSCYGGLYRVNSKGHFNVPYAEKINGKEILNVNNNLAWQKMLNNKKTKIFIGDFEEIIKKSKKGDFIFVDPPYFAWSKTANFTSYTKEGFNLNEQKRLLKSLQDANKRGVKFLLTNTGNSKVKDFYSMFNVKRVPIVRTIARSKNKRGYFEYIVTNY